MSVNYVRVLRKAKCNKCDYRGYDSNFENYLINEVEPYQFKSSINIVCPKCNEKDSMIILDDFKPITTGNINIKYNKQ